jgi:uncharacterized protein YndB with AHSA1/START domain
MAEQPGITIVRTFDAPRERVWREWTEPESFADWFGGSAEVPLASVSMDVRPGGAWRLTMLAEGSQIDWHGEYREVVEPERLVLTFCDQPDPDHVEVVTVLLTDVGDGRTEMHFEQRGELSPEHYERASKGWSGFFDRVAERLAAG